MLEQINKEYLYQHIVNLEGLRHPIDDYEMLNASAEYILAELEAYGLEITEHVFKIDDVEFRNVEGKIEEKQGPEILITSHYDTATLSPGANDNASGIAGMLEIARVLSQNDYNGNIRFVSFTLEELHPKTEIQIRDLLLDSGLVNENFRFLDYQTIEILDKVDELREQYITEGKSLPETWSLALATLDDQLTKKQMNYLKKLKKLFSSLTRLNWIGESICVGSSEWVKSQRDTLKTIKGVLNLEAIGYISKKKFSQEYPQGLNPLNYPGYKIDIENRIGNFVGIFGDINSKKLAQTFGKQCELDIIDLPYHNLQLDLTYSEIAHKIIDMLRSDHSPFWREGIPAISITDTFEFRYPFYHTEADVVDNINFDYMKKVCQATLATIVEIENLG